MNRHVLASGGVVGVILTVWIWSVAARSIAARTTAGVAGSVDLRTIELLDLQCGSELGRWRLTLFANGTVRHREWRAGQHVMRLGELDEAQLTGFTNRLRDENLDETAPSTMTADGAWAETCRLTLRRSVSEAPQRFEFSRWATLSLSLARVLAISEELRAEADVEVGLHRLPAGYQVRTGDLLRRVDGEVFRVVGPTADKSGWELAGVVVPLTVYLRGEEIPRQFVGLVSRESPPPGQP